MYEKRSGKAKGRTHEQYFGTHHHGVYAREMERAIGVRCSAKYLDTTWGRQYMTLVPAPRTDVVNPTTTLYRLNRVFLCSY